MIRILLGLVFLAASAMAGVVDDAALGYSLELPKNWVPLKSKPLQHYFRDSTKQFKSQISILRHAVDKATYPTPESWSEAQFIAYKLTVETSVFPFGSVQYFDSSATTKIGTHWAPEAFSILYPADGNPTYCEYIRYVANGDFGYEIYAIGDSTDMVGQVDYYAGIIATLKLSVPDGSITKIRRVEPSGAAVRFPVRSLDLLGRKRSVDRAGHFGWSETYPLSNGDFR